MQRILLTTVGLLPALLAAQQPATPKDTTPASNPPAASAKPAAPTPAPIDFSGVILGNFQYRGDKGASKGQNKFDLERAYLTFKMPAGDRASIRITTDVFQQTSSPSDAYYKGWVVRAKYAYLQYNYLKNDSWTGVVRAGLLHNMFIDHEENFWPRWMSQVPVERAGFFSSADAGLATVVTMPNKLGEFYAQVINGSGYTSRETDRFKDYAARVTFTPFANEAPLPLLKTFALDVWGYKGEIASTFVNGGTGQVGPVAGGLRRDRIGAFAGIRDPRLVIGLDYANRMDEGEKGANTTLSPRTVVDSTGRLMSAYTIVRPFMLMDAKSTIPLGLVARWDQIKPNTSAGQHYYIFIGGLTWDLSKKTAFSLDYQEQTPSVGSTQPVTKTYFLHWVANF